MVALHHNIVAELVADTSRCMKGLVGVGFVAPADVGLASFPVLFMSRQRKSSGPVGDWWVPLWLLSIPPILVDYTSVVQLERCWKPRVRVKRRLQFLDRQNV
jgi:hypothetical protein